MFKEVILKQRESLESLIKQTFISRDKSTGAKRWLKSDLIKIIIGPRRAGKSVFSFLLIKGQPFSYLNFDDENFSVWPTNYDDFLKDLVAVYGETKILFFDEIQNLPNWELFVNRLQRQGYNLILTGSNAKLLSSELATHLTGRHIPIEILPFSFAEYLRAEQIVIDVKKPALSLQKLKILNLLEQYIKVGGYPELVVKKLEPQEYLKILFGSLLLKDVIKRHYLKFSPNLEKLSIYLINNIATEFSYRRLASILEIKSDVTLEKYLKYLVEAYLFFALTRYSHKTGNRLRAPRKIYVIDSGFIEALAVKHSADFGRRLENLVFLELLNRGFEPNRRLFYYKTRNDREVDFLLYSGLKAEELIQVTEHLDEHNSAREIKALVEAAGELKVKKLTIVTWEEEREEINAGLKIKIVPLWRWLLEK